MKHMRLKQDITMIFKGLKEIHTIRPWLLTLAMVGGMFSALTPFVNIYMGTRIINGIVGKQTFRELLWLSFLTVILNAVIQLCASVTGDTAGQGTVADPDHIRVHTAGVQSVPHLAQGRVGTSLPVGTAVDQQYFHSKKQLP